MLAEQLRARGCRDIVIPRKAVYDLTHESAVKRFYAEQAARTDATVLASTVFAGVIAALPQTGAGVETPNLPLGTPLAAASPSVTSCVGSPC